MKSAETNTAVVDQLAAEWRKSGIETGDLVLIHSDLKTIVRKFLRKKVRLEAETVLASFREAVGPEGTLLFPLFNFEFTKGVPFDIRNTPSHMGALSEAARLAPDAVRTGHPIYSFAALGARGREFDGVDNFSGYGPDSPFAMLRQRGGRIAVLDLPDQNSMTFYHHVEEMMNVPYRYHKKFTAPYTDRHGTTTEKTYGLFVRDLEKGVVTDVEGMAALLWKTGLYQGSHAYEGNGLRVISATKLFDFCADAIKSGRALGLLYRVVTSGTPS